MGTVSRLESRRMTASQLLRDDATLGFLGAFVIFAGLFLFMTRWRARYLRFVEAEHRLIKALGFSERTFASTRRIEESREYMVLCGILTLIALACLVVTIALRLHYGSHWPSDSANERTSGNGAVARWCHVQRLRRAAPDRKRSGSDYRLPITV